MSEYASAESQREEQRAREAERYLLAFDIIRHAQNIALLNLHFLDSALFKLVPQVRQGARVSTDGLYLYYDANHVLKLFAADRNCVVRDILHTVLHCVFRHVFVGPTVLAKQWDIASDIAIESQITDMGIPALNCDRALRQAKTLQALSEELPQLSAQKLYRFFVDSDFSDEELDELREPFYADDHDMWYEHTETSSPSASSEEVSSDVQSLSLDGEDDELSQESFDFEEENDPSSGDQEGQDQEGSTKSEGSSEEEGESDTPGVSGYSKDAPDDGCDGGASALEGLDSDENSEGDELREQWENEPDGKAGPDAVEQEWQSISERLEVELETTSRAQGDSMDSLMRALKTLNREKYDYATFLRQFAAVGEVMQVNDEEFDYIYYTYGLKLYENMPLVEPLEFQEAYRIREFVIAIDTSASTSGDLVEKFVTKTYNMLKATENFHTRVNVHIIQSDREVKDVVKIETAEEFSEYLEGFKLYGMGGTDFRPVFEYVDKCIDEGEFKNLGGLIYFTDGLGTFPETQPLYKTAFVFVEDEGNDRDVPIWAIKLVMESEDV